LGIKNGVSGESEASAPFWRFPFTAGNGLDSVAGFAKILTGEIPLIAKNKAANRFYLYVPAFKQPDLDTLTTKGLRLCRTQPSLAFNDGDLNPQADAVLPESEALELARFYWEVMRSRYRQLGIPEFDFKIDNVGRGELIWLPESGLITETGKIGKGQAAFHG
jgi:hypothetical protein